MAPAAVGAADKMSPDESVSARRVGTTEISGSMFMIDVLALRMIEPILKTSGFGRDDHEGNRRETFVRARTALSNSRPVVLGISHCCTHGSEASLAA
jgi:hypothetical protein